MEFVQLLVLLAHRLWRRIRPRETAEATRLCPKCGYDLRASGNRCPECGVILLNRSRYLLKLTWEWPDNPIGVRRVLEDEELVFLHSAMESKEAELLKEQLNARGIGVWVSEGPPIGVPSLNDYSESRPHRIFVRAGDYELALAYLHKVQGMPESVEPDAKVVWMAGPAKH